MSTTKPPASSSISSAVVVVCFPFDVHSETSRTFRFRSGWMAFKSELLPTPLWPVTAVDAGCEQVPQAIETSTVGDRGHDRFVSQLHIEADDPLVELPGRPGRPC